MMTVHFLVTVLSVKDNGEEFKHRHDLSSEGETYNECFRKALDLLAESFPTDKGKHVFTEVHPLDVSHTIWVDGPKFEKHLQSIGKGE
tara:strand:+ start:265 stop:528 length:264 start_codon:yes stop_codon:yes gene_type:complete